MDPYLDPSHDPGRNRPVGGKPDPYWDILRKSMGLTRTIAERLDLAAVVPHDELASTQFCLADPGKEYLKNATDRTDRRRPFSAVQPQTATRQASSWRGVATNAGPARILTPE
jgi:hypothetical protein